MVYEAKTGKKLREWSYQRPKATAQAYDWPQAVSGDGRFVVVGGDSPVLILEAETGKEYARVATTTSNVRTRGDIVPTVVVPANGSKLAVINRTKIEVYDAKTSKVVAQHTFQKAAPIRAKFSPDGKWLAMWYVPGSGQDACVYIWDIGEPQGEPRKLVADPWVVALCAAFSPNNASLAVGYNDGTALIWDLTAK